MSTSTSTNDSAAAKFAEIKGMVLSYMDEMTKKNKEEEAPTGTSNNKQASTGEDDATEKMKLQFTTLLQKVTSFVNKEEDKSGKEQSGTSAAQGEGEKSSDTFSAEDLQMKLTGFVKSLSFANKTAQTDSTTDTSTQSESEKKDPVKDIMDQLKSAFPNLNKSEGSNTRSLGTIDESSEKPNPVEEFVSFVQGILHKDNIEKNVEGAKETMKDSATAAKKSVDEGPEKNPILCGVF